MKWLLVLPHVIVLVFLWLAASVLTFVAGVSILFTARYPRSLFEFNVGVMRWTWRVGFYSISLEPDPSYQADFDVDYPQQLSRGLVLVKWWLLALPHLLIVAVLAGDEYPPFRLDSGGEDPGHVPVEPPPAPQPAGTASSR